MVLGGFFDYAFGVTLARFTMIAMMRATKGKPRSTNHWIDSWIVSRGLKMLGLRWVPPVLGVKKNDFFLRGFRKRILVIFGGF